MIMRVPLDGTSAFLQLKMEEYLVFLLVLYINQNQLVCAVHNYNVNFNPLVNFRRIS